MSLVSIVVEAVSSLELRSQNQILEPNPGNQSREGRSKEPIAQNIRIDHAQRGRTQAIKSLIGCKPKETRDFFPQ